MIELQTLMLLIAAQNYCGKLHGDLFMGLYLKCLSRTTECLEKQKYALTNKNRIDECLK